MKNFLKLAIIFTLSTCLVSNSVLAADVKVSQKSGQKAIRKGATKGVTNDDASWFSNIETFRVTKANKSGTTYANHWSNYMIDIGSGKIDYETMTNREDTTAVYDFAIEYLNTDSSRLVLYYSPASTKSAEEIVDSIKRLRQGSVSDIVQLGGYNWYHVAQSYTIPYGAITYDDTYFRVLDNKLITIVVSRDDMSDCDALRALYTIKPLEYDKTDIAIANKAAGIVDENAGKVEKIETKAYKETDYSRRDQAAEALARAMQQAYEENEAELARTGETKETVFQSMGPAGMGGDYIDEEEEEEEYYDED
jgi:hypothetical protein